MTKLYQITSSQDCDGNTTMISDHVAVKCEITTKKVFTEEQAEAICLLLKHIVACTGHENHQIQVGASMFNPDDHYNESITCYSDYLKDGTYDR